MGARVAALADLLTAAGTAFGTANARLGSAGAPALLKEANLSLDFHAAVVLGPEGLSLVGIAQPGVQLLALAGRQGRLSNTRLAVTLVAAPALRGTAT